MVSLTVTGPGGSTDMETQAGYITVHPRPIAVNFIVRPWVKTSDYWDTYWDLTKAIKLRFDKEGISIPYPQRDVHVIEQKS